MIKKHACKNAYLGSIFITEKYVFRVFWKPFYEDDIHPKIQASSPYCEIKLLIWENILI